MCQQVHRSNKHLDVIGAGGLILWGVFKQNLCETFCVQSKRTTKTAIGETNSSSLVKAGSSILSIEGIDCIMQRSWAELTLEDPDTLVEEVGPWQRRPMRCDRVCPAAPILGPQDAPSDPPLLELIPSLASLRPSCQVQPVRNLGPTGRAF